MKQLKRCVPLEEAANEICDKSAVRPMIFELPPKEGRQRLENIQNMPVYMHPANISVRKVNTESHGAVPVYLVVPKCSTPIQNVIFYIHGAGWVFGSFHTHEKLVRELAARTSSLVVFPEYSRAPEVKYPVAVEQCYYVLSHLWELVGSAYPNINRDTLTVAGDSVGGNMAIAEALIARERGGPQIQKLLLYYPVTNACFDTPSYKCFAVDYYLYRDGMKWFWEQYAPCETDRNRITVSPLRADIKTLRGLPDTMIINGQADVLRSEGEAFGEKLRCAGVDVTALCVQGTIHDFVMLNALDNTNACRAAMDASAEWINRKNKI